MVHFNPLATRIVLVQPSHPGNIGSAARAMKTMGFHDLAIVNPRRYPAPEANMMAAGADDILAQATIYESIDAAIADRTLVLGTSARDRSLPWPLVNPDRAADLVLQETNLDNTAILFGREDKGLKNEELQKCHYHIQIPANPEYSSLNLSQAVQVICYQIRMKLFLHKGDSYARFEGGHDDKLADANMLELFFQHVDKTLHDMEFLSQDNPNRVMPRVRRLFNRARLDQTELNILRGILSKMQWHLHKETDSK